MLKKQRADEHGFKLRWRLLAAIVLALAPAGAAGKRKRSDEPWAAGLAGGLLEGAPIAAEMARELSMMGPTCMCFL
jgi:hypothetical protein